MSAVVDVHCHTFNGDDLPVQGFVQKVAFHDAALASAMSRLADKLVQGRAPGYQQELQRLEPLLSDSPGIGKESLEVTQDLDAAAQAEVEQLRATDPALAATLDLEMPAPPLATQEGLGDAITGAQRAVKWALLFASYRVDVTTHLVKNFGDTVDLFTPMLVDLAMGLGDVPMTSVAEQVDLQERISRLSMLGRLPDVSARARVHPFVGFDPRREVQARRSGAAGPMPLDVVREAVRDKGFVGVKMYPPMGFRPLGNTVVRADKVVLMTADDAREVDAVLRELYRWCEDEQVPITAHCNRSNGALPVYEDFSHPMGWQLVLQSFPELHLNLGHFGGSTQSTDWPEHIARLMATYPHLHTDVGNHRIDRPDIATAYIDQLARIFDGDDTGTAAERLMYGSDWFMLAALPQHETFKETYESLYADRFGEAATRRFMGEAALDFLGFSDPANQNAVRLRARYEACAPAVDVPGWLAPAAVPA